MGLKVNLNTGFIDPCYLHTLSFLCSVKEANGNDFPLDPRTILEKAQAYFASFGLGTLLYAPELEFYLIEPDLKKQEEISKWFPKLPTHYHLSPPLDLYFFLRSKMVNEMEKLGIPVKYHHPEVGGTQDGTQQQEIEFSFAPPLETADNYTLARYIIENLADQNGKVATFDPKPLKEKAGSGLHTHLYISQDGKSRFYSSENPYHLSELALQFIGGILKHAGSLSAFTNLTLQSYARLDPKFEAPRIVSFNLGDRTAAVRIPEYTFNPEEARFEYRPPDASGNYYLVLAAMIMAGLDGIANKIDPVKEGFGPEPKKRKKKLLPCTLSRAIRELKKDHAFLLQGDVFPVEIIELQRKTVAENSLIWEKGKG